MNFMSNIIIYLNLKTATSICKTIIRLSNGFVKKPNSVRYHKFKRSFYQEFLQIFSGNWYGERKYKWINMNIVKTKKIHELDFTSVNKSLPRRTAWWSHRKTIHATKAGNQQNRLEKKITRLSFNKFPIRAWLTFSIILTCHQLAYILSKQKGTRSGCLRFLKFLYLITNARKPVSPFFLIWFTERVFLSKQMNYK